MSDTGTSISETVAALTAAEAPPEEKVEAKPETEIEAVPAADSEAGAEEPTGGEEAEDQEQEGDEPQPDALAPPPLWDAKAKERFGELPRDLQELLLTKETERNSATSKAIQEAAEKRKAADGEAARMAAFSQNLDRLIPQAESTFQSRWANVDWNAVVDQHGADQAFKLRNQFEQEQATLQQLQAAKGEADKIQFSKFVEAETAKLAELAPELVDPVKGNQRRQDLGKFLLNEGIAASAISHMSAKETALAYEAMCWRQSKEKAASQANKPKPAAPVSKTPVKPTGAIQRGSQQSAGVKALENRFNQTKSAKDLVALLEARG